MNRLKQWLTLLANLSVLLGRALIAYEIRQNTDAFHTQTPATLFSGAQEELITDQPEYDFVEKALAIG